MMITGAKWCDFITYDPRVVEEALQLSWFRVERNDDMIKSIQVRLKQVKEKFDELINELK